MAGQAMLQRVDLLTHGTRVADDAPCPVEHAFALRREAAEAGAALNQEHAERVLKLLDAGREGRLTYAAGLGRATEMPLAGERYNEFELIEHKILGADPCENRI
jgi:hypothetical protein